MNRRHLLMGCCAGLGAGLFTGLGLATERALRNPCRGPLPDELARHDLVLSALQGLDAARLVDTHAHLLGTGDSGSGCSVHPSLHQWWHPLEVLRRKAILQAACVDEGLGSIDLAYVERLRGLTLDFPAGARWWLYAFEQAHDDAGRPDPARSTFHVPGACAARVAAAQPGRFAWVASIHPYRPDALQRLQQAAAGGAVAVKWLPSAMNIDLRSPRCHAFYDQLVRHRLPLVVHCGEEKAVPGAGREELGNPLHARHPLDSGVTVVMAHCGSLGTAADEDRRSHPPVPAFSLFARLMDETPAAGRLLGDLSAVFQRNRTPDVWTTVMQRQEWHGRLPHGSDHPLQGVMPLFAPRKLVQAGLLDEADVPVLLRVREHNPLLFGLLLKRRLRVGGRQLPVAVFEGHTQVHPTPTVEATWARQHTPTSSPC